jgi:predicted Zn-dependent protease
MDAIGTILDYAEDLDLVGLWACGSQCYGFASSFGQSAWFCTDSFNLDASVHLASGPAVKVSYAGRDWDPAVLGARMQRARQHMRVLREAPCAIGPGRYRAYLAPQALAELTYLLSFAGFSKRALENRCSPLQDLHLKGRALNESVSVRESRQEGFLPGFSRGGFALPDTVKLIEQGQAGELLVDRRSALEYKVATNADSEAASNLVIDPGSLDETRVPDLLGSGIYVGNLWYSNFSDLYACRVTGSTRFACFWVEQGQFVAPLATTRFDDSLLNLLGSKLIGLTSASERMLSPGTYTRRSGASVQLPGILVDDMQFVM